jgi:hypothetical protein
MVRYLTRRGSIPKHNMFADRWKHRLITNEVDNSCETVTNDERY